MFIAFNDCGRLVLLFFFLHIPKLQRCMNIDYIACRQIYTVALLQVSCFIQAQPFLIASV